MAAEANGDEETLGPDPIQDRIGVGRHIIRARPSASRLGLRHSWESFRKSRSDIPGGSGGWRGAQVVGSGRPAVGTGQTFGGRGAVLDPAPLASISTSTMKT